MRYSVKNKNMSEVSFSSVLKKFSPITLKEMSMVRFMNRIDTKYVTTKENLIPFLSEMSEDYYVQKINNKRIALYHTLYMDTPDLEMYIAHQDDRSVRQKVRIREYVDSNLSFFEVKNRDNKGRILKERIVLSDFKEYNSEEGVSFIEKKTPYNMQNLIPQLENSFERITLVNKEKTLRLTIDQNISFNNIQTSLKNDLLSDLVVIEIKHDGKLKPESRSLLKNMNIHQEKISKYCVGSVLTNPDLKYNRFKPKLYFIKKIINTEINE